MKKKKCNGYFYICQYKGTPIAELKLTFPKFKSLPERTYPLRLCEKCCQRYIEQHPEAKKDIEQAILLNKIDLNKAIKNFLEAEQEK